MISTLICSALLFAPTFTCPVAGHEAPADGPKIDYAGVRYTLCCPDCVPAFQKEPAKYAKTKEAGQTIGVALFDMTSGAKLDLKNAKATATIGGVLYPFASDANRAAFVAKAEAEDYKPVTKEAVYCPVMNHGIESVAKSGGFVDYQGVRYYVCCPNCLGKLKADPAKFAPNAKSAVRDAKPEQVK